MITKARPEILDELFLYAPPKPQMHLTYPTRSQKKKRYSIMWKEWRFYGESLEELRDKLMVFKKYNYYS